MAENYPQFDGTQICAQTDPELWFPTSEKQTGRLAKSLCNSCPWRTSCLEYSLFHEVLGIWGGTTERERRIMRKRLEITPEPLYSDSLFSVSARGKVSRYNEQNSEVLSE